MTVPPRPARPATGRSFLIVLAVAGAVGLAVIGWTLYSASHQQQLRGGPAQFRM